MSTVEALSRQLCQACGAQSVWSAEKQKLVCLSCGSESEVTEVGGSIQEHSLLTELQSASSDKRGWATQKKSVRCQHCNAVSVFDPETVAKNCDFCGSAQLIPQENIQSQYRPESLLPFKVGDHEVREILKSWFKKVWFAPNNFSTGSMADVLHGVYIPYWTFDAQVNASWKAEAGYFYYTTQTITDSHGKTRIKNVQHTRWEKVNGDISHFFNDQLVSASLGVKGHLLEKVEPFPTEQLIPYNPSYVTGWTVEQYQVDLENAAKQSSVKMKELLKKMIIRRIPGDTYQNLSFYPRYSSQTFKHILAPVWVVSYRYGQKTFQVLVNGNTGTIAGDYPKSWIKIALAVIGGLTIVAAIILALARLQNGNV